MALDEHGATASVRMTIADDGDSIDDGLLRDGAVAYLADPR